ncbi:MAG: UDP-N-acetylglucosamine 2-epimerase [Gemmatimonadetes bacterium]|nr:UDP-N-acetylglucosamine 2-epimerase [Gemmatimonadota bacterium]
MLGSRLTVILVAGARPNFMKIAPILRALQRSGHRGIIVHTGQHYDDSMSGSFFRDLDIRTPDYHLGIGSASHAVQTARVMEAFEPILLVEKPDWVLVPGDVNSTLACALVCAKLKETTGVRLAHLEAGLRSNDWRMPEEVNRVLTDRCSDLLLIPSHDATANLRREGIDERRIAFIGNVMIDTLLDRLPTARVLDVPTSLGLTPSDYVLATLHRPSNVDDRAMLSICLSALGVIAGERPVVLPMHPRTRKQVSTFGLDALLAPLRVIDPIGYMEMLGLSDSAAAVVTDSGGVQEETTALGVPCVTLREQTERPVTVTEGTNQLAPWPLSTDGILRTYRDAVSRGRVGVGARSPEGWDGHAAERAVLALEGMR